jgi:hypothetical protein
MSTDEFESIKIVGCDEAKVKKQAGDKQNYAVPFSISAKPPNGWGDLFEKSWRAARKSSRVAKADAYLKKGDLVVETSLGDLTLHFPILKSAVAEANSKYLEEIKEKAEKDGKKKHRRHQEREAELVAIREALAGLDFS